MNLKLVALTLTCAAAGLACGGVEEDASSEAPEALNTTPSLQPVEICFRYNHSFELNGGDFPTAANIKGRGLLFEIAENGGVSSSYSASTTTGCKIVSLKRNSTHTVTAFSFATFADGNTLLVMSDEGSKALYQWTASTSLIPSALVVSPGTTPSVTYTWELSASGSRNITNVMAAATKFFVDHSFTSDKLYPIYANAGPCLGGVACFDPHYDPLWPAIWMADDLRDKFAIAHEMAHMALHHRLGASVGESVGAIGNYSLGYIPLISSTCADGPGHKVGDFSTSPPGTIGAYPLGSEELGNAAFDEGFAAYISASLWNRVSDADCQYVDVDCYEPGRAFDYCYTDAGISQVAPTGFERDWLTAFWALERTDGCGLPVQTIVDIVANAHPENWTDGSAKDWLLLSAPSILTNLSDLTCFVDTLDDRIAF